jgi:hypothetical protein
MTDFESFPAEWEYPSRGMGIQSLWRDACEEFFSPRDWTRLAAGESIIWHDEFGVKYVVTRCDDPLEREDHLVSFDEVEAELASLEWQAEISASDYFYGAHE